MSKPFFLNTHLGYSLNFTVVYHCLNHGGIPPPNRGIVGKNRSTLDLDKSLKCPPAGSWQPCCGLPFTGAGLCLNLNARHRTMKAEYSK